MYTDTRRLIYLVPNGPFPSLESLQVSCLLVAGCYSTFASRKLKLRYDMPRLARSYNGEIQKDMGYSPCCSQRIQHVSVSLLLFPPSLSALLPPAAACLCAQRVSAQSSPQRNGQALWAWDHFRIIRIPGLYIHIHAISTRPCPCHLSFN